MVEGDNHLRPLHTSMLDMYKVFELLVCCLKGIWVHPYTIPWANLAPDLVFRVACGGEMSVTYLEYVII